MDGEDDTLTEPVVIVVIFFADQADILQQLLRVFAAKMGQEGIIGRSIAEHEGINRLFFQMSLAQVITRSLAGIAVKGFVKERRRIGEAFQAEVVVVFFLRIIVASIIFVGHIQPVKGSELFDCFGEGQIVVIHQEADGIATDATAKAVIETFLGVDAERGCLFLMKRAASPMVAARFAGKVNPRR